MSGSGSGSDGSSSGSGSGSGNNESETALTFSDSESSGCTHATTITTCSASASASAHLPSSSLEMASDDTDSAGNGDTCASLDYAYRTESDYEDAWLHSMVQVVDEHLGATATERGHARVRTAWRALRNTLLMQHAEMRNLNAELGKRERELFDWQRQERCTASDHTTLLSIISHELSSLHMEEWSDEE